MSDRKVIAAIYAHPDDGEFFAAGSLAKWVKQGHTVFAICATNGDLGSKRRDVSKEKLAQIRSSELGLALAQLGGQPPIMLGFPDGHLSQYATALRERLIYFLRKLAVDRVVTFDPWKRYEIHPDHITAGKMASEAAVFACFPLLHPEHLEGGVTARQPEEVFYMMPTEHKPNRLVDITATFDTKVRSLLCHSSQIEMLADWFVKGADPTQLTDAQRAELESGARNFLQMMAQGVAMMKPEVSLAEAFYVQRVGPGHFQNYQEMFQETLGVPPGDPTVE